MLQKPNFFRAKAQAEQVTGKDLTIPETWFHCPRCKDYLIFDDIDGFLEQIGEDNDCEYICPMCGERF